jgi:hypothetical protein
MDHGHQRPGNRDQGRQAEVDREHADRELKGQGPRGVVRKLLIASSGSPEDHDESLAYHKGYQHEERDTENHADYRTPPHVPLGPQDLRVTGTVRR